MHCFKVPARLRADSDGMLHGAARRSLGGHASSGEQSSEPRAGDSISAMAVDNEEEWKASPVAMLMRSAEADSRSQVIRGHQTKYKFHPAKLQAMQSRSKFSSRSSHGGSRSRHGYAGDQRSNKSRNLSVSSLPTIAEEGKKKGAKPSKMRPQSGQSGPKSLLAVASSEDGVEESKGPAQQVLSEVVVDEESSSSSNDDSLGEPLASKFVERQADEIHEEVEEVDEADEIASPVRSRGFSTAKAMAIQVKRLPEGDHEDDGA